MDDLSKMTPVQIFDKLKQDGINIMKEEVAKVISYTPEIKYSGLVAEVTLILRMNKVHISTQDIMDYCHKIRKA